MYADISKPPAPLPTPRPQDISQHATLLPPLSRRGNGPGLIILVDEANATLDIIEGTPSLLVKWAEEGYTVVAITSKALEVEGSSFEKLLRDSVSALAECEDCNSKGGVGLVGKYSHDHF